MIEKLKVTYEKIMDKYMQKVNLKKEQKEREDMLQMTAWLSTEYMR